MRGVCGQAIGEWASGGCRWAPRPHDLFFLIYVFLEIWGQPPCLHECRPHLQGQVLNAANLAGRQGVDGKTVAAYLNLMVDLMLVRRLPSWHRNEGKRLVKAPKVYVRDSGLTPALLAIPSKESLLAHPVVGSSWESFVIENLVSVTPPGTEWHYHRTTTGNEIDLVLKLPSNQLWAIEVKLSSAPKVSKGFRLACADLKPDRRFLVYSGTERFSLDGDVDAIGLNDLAALVAHSSSETQ